MTINPMVDMASFTAFDLPTDKEDIFWDDSITKGSTDFFDQFVVLDDCNTDWTNAGDFAFSSLGKDAATQDILPPTSIGPLSVSSNASVDLTCTATSSSHSHTGPIGTPGGVHQQPYHPTLNVAHEASHLETVEQRHLHMSSRRLPVGASISDAELLKLEGLSMRSPIRAARPPIPETFLPPSPPLQSATTVRPQATDAKKRSRLESIYATIRKAAHIRTRPRVDQQSVPIPQTVVPANLSPKKTHRRLKSENMTATQARNFPLSPPMSNPMPDLPHQSHGEPGFVTGFLDDPFFEPNGHLAPPAQINGATVPNTPLDTPQMEGHNRHAVGIVPTSLALDQTHGLPLSNWPLATTTMAEVTSMDWPSSTYVTASAVDDQWWEGPGAHDIDMAGAHDFQANAKNASLNLNLQLQPQEFHNSGMEDFANGGLMIHMPQPRTPNAAPLLAKDVAMNERPPLPPPPPAEHAPPMPSPTRGYHTEHRRPKPRAPSTGARHGLALTSPRKRQSSQSSSRSTSPTPGAGAGRMKRSSSLQPVCPSFGQPSATGAAVRKRKSAASISKRNYTPHAGGGGFAEPRTPNPQGNGGGCDIGFVNFTPSDHNILMTGVAPSGSSKTKARREKEAAEKQRKMSEAFLKAVKAAGADVTKLKEEGIVM